MNEAETLVKKITEGIQEKKGKNIVIADLTAINDTICSYFITFEHLDLVPAGDKPSSGGGEEKPGEL